MHHSGLEPESQAWKARILAIRRMVLNICLLEMSFIYKCYGKVDVCIFLKYL